MSKSTGQHTHQKHDIEAAGLSPSERILLIAARFYFTSHMKNDQPYWEAGLDLCLQHFGEEFGPLIGVRLMHVVRSMRASRKTVFQFTNPFCEACGSKKISDCERLLMSTIVQARGGARSVARMQALILCEGHDVDDMLSNVDALNVALCRAELEQIPQL
ncbi:MAG: hypothetical protein AAF468_19515 [Pseudomonadota bacterium]